MKVLTKINNEIKCIEVIEASVNKSSVICVDRKGKLFEITTASYQEAIDLVLGLFNSDKVNLLLSSYTSKYI